jgi:transmembrane sensor
MNSRASSSPDAAAVDRVASEWLARHDRGLTATEQDAFSQWLAADPRHRAAWAEHRWGWEELDRLAGLPAAMSARPNPDLLAPRSRAWPRAWFASRPLATLGALAATLVLALLGFRWWLSPPAAREPGADLPALPLIEQRSLADGSSVQLNRGAVITASFSPVERRVRLERGEAHFQVAKDVSRPFVVEVGGVTVRAVGTAFNIRQSASSVEVLVTAGRVAVQPASPARMSTEAPSPPPAENAILAAGEWAQVSLQPSATPLAIQQLSPAEIATRLSWQPQRLEFVRTPLAEIVAAFNRRNPVRLTLANDELAALRLTLTFRSDNVEGFVRLLVSTFGVRAEWREPAEILLHRAAAPNP